MALVERERQGVAIRQGAGTNTEAQLPRISVGVITEGDIKQELYNNHHGDEIISRLHATQQQRNAGYQH